MYELLFNEFLKPGVSIAEKILENRLEDINKAQLEKKRRKILTEHEAIIKRTLEKIDQKQRELDEYDVDESDEDDVDSDIKEQILSIRERIETEISELNIELKKYKKELSHETEVREVQKERDRKVQDIVIENNKLHERIYKKGKNIREKENEFFRNEIRRKEKEIEKIEEKLASLESNRIVLNPNEIIKAELIYSEDVTVGKLTRHLNEVFDWSKEVRFREMIGSKTLRKIYIELDTFLMPTRTHMDLSERSQKIPFNKAIFQSPSHCVIEGQPGSGKTTSAKKLCSNFITSKGYESYKFPLLIKFRQLHFFNSDGSIINFIINLLQLDINFSLNVDLSSDITQKDTLLRELSIIAFDNMFPLVIMDGFDEIPTHKEKEKALEEIRYLTKKLKNAKVIITCRTGMFNFTLENTDAYEIAPLTDEQISLFVHKWLEDDTKSLEFIRAIYDSPFSDTTIKPLSLAHLCAIYQRIGRIPDKPKTIYRKLIWLLLEAWDEERSIKRESNFAGFLPERKYDYLVQLSYQLTIRGHSSVFIIDHLKQVYSTLCKQFDLPEDQCLIVTDEIESHTGLFLQTGFQQYEFVHKSLQEFLTAEYIVKLPNLKHIRNSIEQLGSELAVATSISYDSCRYFTNLVLEIFQKMTLAASFYDAYISRLIQERPDTYPFEDLPIAIFLLYDIAFGSDPKHAFDKGRIMQMHSLSNLFLNGMSVNSLVNSYYYLDRKTKQYINFKLKKQHPLYQLKEILFIPCDDYTERLFKRY